MDEALDESECAWNVVGTYFHSNAPRWLARRSARGYEKPFYKWVAAHSDAYLRSPPTKKKKRKKLISFWKEFLCPRKRKKKNRLVYVFICRLMSRMLLECQVRSSTPFKHIFSDTVVNFCHWKIKDAARQLTLGAQVTEHWLLRSLHSLYKDITFDI